MAVTLARPEASVVAVEGETVAVAPPTDWAVKVTTTFLRPFPAASATAATSGEVKSPPSATVCGVPLTTKTLAGPVLEFWR